jgi:hypothetical protein
MTTNRLALDEFQRIRQACLDLGADEEMTALVLASHRYNRALLDVMVANGRDLLDYVRHKLAVWESIFAESPAEATWQACRSDRHKDAALRHPGDRHRRSYRW